ncbi:MAG: PilZ domain-containing protein [Cellvibrionaceae bacterium]
MDRTNRSYNEKRNFIRMKIDTPADVIIDGKGESFKGICRDLSGGGMLIETETTLEIGLELVVRLASHHEASPMLKARVQVARVLESRDGKYTLGLEILEMLD